MKVRCPTCQAALSVADEHAGKAVRCPNCKNPIRVPKLQTAGVATERGLASTVDLDKLARLESRTTQMGQEELEAAQAEMKAKRLAEAKSGFRTCGKCGKQTPIKDPRVEALCSHCWEPIPGIASDDAYDMGGTKLVGHKGNAMEGTVKFYDGLASALGYPGPAIGSILLAAVIAIVSIFLPVGLMTAVASAVAQSDVGKEGATGAEADLTMVGPVLTGIFLVQLIAFGCVALTAFFDSVRTTAIGEETPPTLSWNPNSWGRSIVAVVALAFYLGLAGYLMVTVAAGPEVAASLMGGSWIGNNEFDFKPILGPGLVVGMVIVLSLVPMHLIGMSLGSIGQGFNPVRAFKSIAKTHIHYVFLVALLCVYFTLGAAAFLVILDWFVPRVQAAAAVSKKGAMGALGVGLVGWGAMMGFTFYLNFVLGRIHGLFARTYRKNIEFGEK